MLKEHNCRPFDEDMLHDVIEKEVASYKQTKPLSMSQPPKKIRYAYVKNPGGITLDIPEKDLNETLKRPGFTFIQWADEAQAEMEELFKADDKTEVKGSYHGTTAGIESDFRGRNAADDKEMFGGPTDTEIRSAIKELENATEDTGEFFTDEKDIKDVGEVTKAPTVETKSQARRKTIQKASKPQREDKKI
jgi:hypothetical protein